MHVGLTLRKNFAISYLSFILREPTLKAEYLTLMTLSPELNKTLAKALRRPISSSSTSRGSHTAWADHVPLIPLTLLCTLLCMTLCTFGGLPTSTAHVEAVKCLISLSTGFVSVLLSTKAHFGKRSHNEQKIVKPHRCWTH